METGFKEVWKYTSLTTWVYIRLPVLWDKWMYYNMHWSFSTVLNVVWQISEECMVLLIDILYMYETSSGQEVYRGRELGAGA